MKMCLPPVVLTLPFIPDIQQDVWEKMSLAEKRLCVELDVASDLLPAAADARNNVHFWALFVQKRETAHTTGISK